MAALPTAGLFFGPLVVGIVIAAAVGGSVATTAANPAAAPTASQCVVSGAPGAAVTVDNAGLTVKGGPASDAQIEVARQIIEQGRAQGVSERGTQIALMVATVESTMTNNITVDPSLNDATSLGVFQQQDWWASKLLDWPIVGRTLLDHRFDVKWATSAFFGGPDGPNAGSPAGLLDLADWEDMDMGEAAWRVQLPLESLRGEYAKWEDEAAAFLAAASGGCGQGGGQSGGQSGGQGGGQGGDGWWQPAIGPIFSGYGLRNIKVPGASKCHAGTDMGGGGFGGDIRAARDGTVLFAGAAKNGMGIVTIDHGGGVKTRYLHMNSYEIFVKTGDSVAGGQLIALVGSTGVSGGPHLHFEVFDQLAPDGLCASGEPGNAIDAAPFMAAKGIDLNSTTLQDAPDGAAGQAGSGG